MKDWTKDLTEDQLCIMRCLSGLVSDIKELMGIMTRNMPERMAHLVKLGYVDTLIKALELEENNERRN